MALADQEPGADGPIIAGGHQVMIGVPLVTM